TINGVDGVISANAGTEGNGGTISLNFPNATVRVPGGETFSANAHGIEAANGGSITLNARRIETQGPGSISLQANGSDAFAGIGSGGTIGVTTTGPGRNIGCCGGGGQVGDGA